MVIVDRLTKRLKLITTKTTATAEETAELFMKHYVKDHGLPKWTDGANNRFIEDYLRTIVNPSQDNWQEHLHLAEFAYNRRVHSSVSDPEFGNLAKSAQDFLVRQQTLLKSAQDAMSEAQERMKSYYDRNRQIQVFSIGEEVLLGLKIHPVFHTSLLKPYLHDDKRQQKPSKVMLKDGSEGQLVKAIIGHRRRKKKSQYLVWWLGETKDEATWEPQKEVVSRIQIT
ncbi:TPA: hypothetical protein N0F65_003671 [Lagenidium giganteum]|uniref:Chromo domain-containing protein n=1 Tax=Lagenidium giganteum TaxID=4803 RepID=A0AAV2YH16_9STRA|nr:TPA: hypothetical protein N0F65_003671 [Lagenidium giganteum]